MAQIVLLDLVDVDAVVANFAVGNVVEPGQQVGNGRLARAGGADKGDLLARLGVNADVMQHDFLRRVAEVHVVQHDVAFQLGVGGGTVAVRMLPRPQAGAMVAFAKLAVLIPLGVHQRDVAFVGLAGFVHQAEDALRARQRHDDGGKLLAHLRDGHDEAAGQGQEGGDHAQRNGPARAGQADVGHAAQAQARADHRQNNVENMAHVVVDGPKDVGEAVGFGGVEAKVVINTVGNIFSGQVVGETAKTLSERFGKVLQKRQSISINRQDVSTSINTQMDSLIPPSKISGLTQGMFVGSVSDNFTERIEQKIFHAEIVVDTDKVKREESHYQPIPIVNDFKDTDGNDCMKQAIQDNYNRIKEDVKLIVKDELERIAADENLKHLIQK